MIIKMNKKAICEKQDILFCERVEYIQKGMKSKVLSFCENMDPKLYDVYESCSSVKKISKENFNTQKDVCTNDTTSVDLLEINVNQGQDLAVCKIQDNSRCPTGSSSFLTPSNG